MTLCFSLAAFRILSLTFAIFIMIGLGVGLFGFILFGTLCFSWDQIYVSTFRSGKSVATIPANTFSAPFSLSLSSFWDLGNANISMLECCPRGHLNHPSEDFFSFCCSDCVIFIILFSRLLIHSASSPNLYSLVNSSFHSYCILSFFFFLLFRAILAYGGSQARGQNRATAAGLYHSHSNTRSEPHLRPTAQLMATPDP